MDALAELKPCPFCGSANISSGEIMGRQGERDFVQTACLKCGASSGEASSKAEADKHWNTRAPVPEAPRRTIVEGGKIVGSKPNPDVQPDECSLRRAVEATHAFIAKFVELRELHESELYALHDTVVAALKEAPKRESGCRAALQNIMNGIESGAVRVETDQDETWTSAMRQAKEALAL